MNPIHTFHPAGIQHSEYRLRDNFVVGHPVKLIHNPDNQYDPNAIEIWYEDVRIGFVPRKDTMIFHKRHAENLPTSAVLTAYDPTAPVWNMFIVTAFDDRETQLDKSTNPNQIA
jgi:hypothetical protein